MQRENKAGDPLLGFSPTPQQRRPRRCHRGAHCAQMSAARKSCGKPIFRRGTAEIWWAKESLCNRLLWNNEAPSGKNYNSTLALYVKINSKFIQRNIQSLNYNNFSTLKKKKKKRQMGPERKLCSKSPYCSSSGPRLPSRHSHKACSSSSRGADLRLFLRLMIETNSLPRKRRVENTGEDVALPQFCSDPLLPPGHHVEGHYVGLSFPVMRFR